MTFFYSIPAFRRLTRAICLTSILLIVLVSTAARAQWTRKADEIRKRAEGNNVIYKNKMYVFGGFFDNPVIEKSNEVYDIAADKWSSLAPFPAGKEITHQGVVLIDDNVWHIGGRAVDAYGPVSSQVIIYNISTNTWSDGPELIDPENGQPFPIGGGGYAVLGRTLHVFGGFGPTICEDQTKLHLTLDIDAYLANPDEVTWENELAPLPISRNHLSYTVLGGKIYAFGGQFKHDCGAEDQRYCHVYDPATDTWTRLADLPERRSHAEASTFAVDGKIFMVAGQGYNNATQGTTYQFTPNVNGGQGEWNNLSNYKLPGTFLGLSAKLAGESFIITNGALDSYSNERKETYIARVNRTSVRTLGFTIPCFSVNLRSGQSQELENILYNIEDTAPYVLTSNASWLKINKNASGTATINGVVVPFTINTTGMAAGSYSAKISAAGPTLSSASSFCVNIVVGEAQAASAVRINAGGGMYNASGNRKFIADAYYGGVDRVDDIDNADILNTEDDALYRTERSSANFNYSVPVSNGNWTVVLHFAEIFFGANGRNNGGAGSRQFNVDIEGSRKLTNYDVFSKAGGALRAIQEIIPVTVSDGILNINFLTGAANLPKISAIEILPAETPTNTPPSLAMIGDKNAVTGQPVTFTASATNEPDQTKTFSLVDAPAGAVINAATGLFSWTPTAAGSFTLTVKVTDNGIPVMSDEEEITITVSIPQTADAIRLNAGGNAFSASGGRTFQADAYYYGVDRTGTLLTSGNILNTTDDALYYTERSSSAFDYKVPVSNGNWNVVLHFAEIWFGVSGRGSGGTGSRMFNVDIEGARKLSNYDIFAKAGGSLRAVQETFSVNVADGILNINFTSGQANLPKISAIEIIPQEAGNVSAVTLTPVADATVRNGNYAGINYGSDPALLSKTGVASGFTRNIYLKFDLSNVSQVSSARLRLFGKNIENAAPVPLSAYGTTSDAWTENGITWNNGPNPAAAVLGKVSVTDQPQYYEIDLTGYIQSQVAGDKIATILLRDASSLNRTLSFNSKEADLNRPQLVIETVAVGALARFGSELNHPESIVVLARSVVFPNPARRSFFVNISEKHDKIIGMHLISPEGRTYPLKLSGSVTKKPEVDVSGLALHGGIYLLQIESGLHRETLKVLIAE